MTKTNRSKLRRKLVLVFNRWIRERDRNKGCISCGGPVEQAGHYYSVGHCPQPGMRFNEQNVNGQCIRCNHFLEGNKQGYAQGLIKRYGKKILDELALKKVLTKGQRWGSFEFESMIKHYQKKGNENHDKNTYERTGTRNQ